MNKILLSLVALATVVFAEVNLSSCYGCHGSDFSKVALGKSKVVSDMSKEDIAASLIGYKNGTYGSNMKGLMAGQVKKYSDAELTAVATVIKGN